MTPIYAGTFDPITNGHLSVIKRMVAMFGRGVVLLATNASKTHMMSGVERQELVVQTLKENDIKTVGVSATYGYVAEWAKTLFPDGSILVRGIRGQGDLEYEMKIADYNRSNFNVDTVFLPAETGLNDVSSSKLKEFVGAEKWSEVSLAAPRCVELFFRRKMYDKK